MLRLFGRIVSGLMLMILGAALWHWRDAWLPKAQQVIRARLPDREATGWTRITRDGANRALVRMAELNSATGPAYVNVPAADFASYVLGSALTRLAEADSAPQALADEGKLWLRTRIDIRDLGGRVALGPLEAMFNDSEPVLVAGRLEGVRAGLAQFRLTDVAIKDLKLPEAAVGQLVRRWGPTTRPEGIAREALPIELPAYVGDVRLSNNRVTLYKTVQ